MSAVLEKSAQMKFYIEEENKYCSVIEVDYEIV